MVFRCGSLGLCSMVLRDCGDGGVLVMISLPMVRTFMVRDDGEDDNSMRRFMTKAKIQVMMEVG